MEKERKITAPEGCEIEKDAEEIHCDTWVRVSPSPLYFKSEYLCDEFLRNFRQLIEKLRPLYGIKEGGEE